MLWLIFRIACADCCIPFIFVTYSPLSTKDRVCEGCHAIVDCFLLSLPPPNISWCLKMLPPAHLTAPK